MALLKPLMIMGGSLSEAARSPSRASLRESIQKIAKNTFSELIQTQKKTEETAENIQASRSRALSSLVKAADYSGNALQDINLARSVQTMIGALSQEIASRPAIYTKSRGSSLGGLARYRDVLPTGSKIANKVRTRQHRQYDDTEPLGSLSASFESGRDIAAIGYDSTGGTSYGKYQIASKPGTMNDFLKFMDKEAPDLARELRKAGRVNTGSRQGKMPETWKKIAAREPDRFEALQEDFIRTSHYEPALEAVRKAGFATEDFSPALKEVLWSTSVQHGAKSAAKIFIRAAEKADPNLIREQEFIKKVYARRAVQFGSSSKAVQASVQNRLRKEQSLALNMMQNNAT